MVTGRDLIENGWPEGPTIGLAVAAARTLRAAGIIHPIAWKENSPKVDAGSCINRPSGARGWPLRACRRRAGVRYLWRRMKMQGDE